MKTASILLALVVVLSIVREAEAESQPPHYYTIQIGETTFGFQDLNIGGIRSAENRASFVSLGPLGQFRVPFSTTQGLVGLCCILAMLIFVPTVLTVRWKKKRTSR